MGYHGVGMDGIPITGVLPKANPVGTDQSRRMQADGQGSVNTLKAISSTQWVALQMINATTSWQQLFPLFFQFDSKHHL